MKLKYNIISSYVSQIYTAAIGIFLVPIYIQYIGIESYGLIGFYAMLQTTFQILDMGLTPTMARETARFNGGAIESEELRRLLRAMELVFFGVALIGGFGMLASADFIATHWLNIQTLASDEVINSIQWMALVIACRWVSGLYRSTITGFEQIVWLSGFNAVAATFRFLLVIPFFLLISTNVVDFFKYQTLVVICETIFLIKRTYQTLPKKSHAQPTPWELSSLKRVLKFSLSMAFLSSVWITINQIDKLILSKLLSLTDYGYFTLAVLAASGILMISGPISSAILPHLTRMQAENDHAGLIDIYRRTTRLMIALVVPACLVLAFFPEHILWVWTGNKDTAERIAPILRLYALGNSILAISAFPYYLQFAKGNLRPHIIGNALLLITFIPSLIWCVIRFGAIGAGYAWFASNFVYFILWTPLAHHYLIKRLHSKWLLEDIAPITISSLLIFTPGFFLVPATSGRLETIAQLLPLLTLALMVNSFICIKFNSLKILHRK